MPRLAIAREEQIDRIYRESHALWGAGLAWSHYRDLWRELSATPWGSRHARFWVWLGDDREVLSSAKVYRPLLRLAGETSRVTVISAIFTPPGLRGRGHATRLMRALIDRAARRDEANVLLFSDIGTMYYASLGFLALPAEEQAGPLPRLARPPAGWSLEPLRDEDRAAIARAHLDYCSRRPIAIVRDPAHWRFLWVRSSSFFERLGDSRLRPCWQVARCERRFAGYLLTVVGDGEWHVREVGAVDGDPETMATVLRLGAREAQARGLARFYGWLPPEVLGLLPDWSIDRRPRRNALPMILPLRESARALTALTTPDGAYLHFQDQF